jgi:hypothetical protein
MSAPKGTAGRRRPGKVKPLAAKAPEKGRKAPQTALRSEPSQSGRATSPLPQESPETPPSRPDQQKSLGSLLTVIEKAKARKPEHEGPGRPTEYRPEYCDVILALAEMGMGVRHMARLIRIGRTSILRWAESAEEFRTALDLARDIRAAVLESELQMAGAAHQVSWRMRVLSNIAADDFKDRASVAVGGDPDAPPVVTANVTADQMAGYNQLVADINKQFGR